MILLIILKVIILLGVLVFIHELGHFLIAKKCNVKVLEFSIGFGPIIFSKQGKETKYALRLIPLGGFVNMLGEEEQVEDERAYNKAKQWKKFLILLAGGFVNIVFGILVYFILVSSYSNYISNTVESVKENYAASQAGIRSGDKIVKVNGKKIRLKSDIDEILSKCNGQKLELTVERKNEILNINIIPTPEKNKTIGIYLGVEGENLSSVVKHIYEGTPAFEAGIEVEDKIITINGENVNDDAYKIVELIQSSTDEIEIEVERNNEKIKFYLNPEITIQYYMGVTFTVAEKSLSNNLYYGFWDTLDFSTSILTNLKKLFTGNVSVDQLTGPIGISKMVAKTQNLIDFIYLLALISLSLGITNLLPFPPLDGGKIMLVIVEKIRKKPLPENVDMALQTTGFILLIILSVFVTYNDILRIF